MTYDGAALAFLGLSTIKGVGFKTLRELGGVAGVDRLIDALGAEEVVRRLSKDAPKGDVEAQVGDAGYSLVEKLRSEGIHLVSRGDSLYPSSFLDLPEELQPLWFFFKGDHSLLQRPSVAVVGTRKPSDAGKYLAQHAVLTLREHDLPTVSGLAHGVDEIVHDWSILAGLPTISVLGTGLLRTYPASNASLAGRIVASGGLLITEYLPDAGPTSEGFVWRNRLQAALGSCLVAPEWKASSGTSHTVRYAKSLGRTTINLTTRTPSQLNPGPADYSFSIPGEQALFVDRVLKSVRLPRTTAQAQLGLDI